MAILDGGQYLKVLPEINSYYMDYYPGLQTATLLNRKEQDIKSNKRGNIIKSCITERK